jgi:hypothetical protein
MVFSVGYLHATFALSIEAANMPFLSSVFPVAVSAYGGAQVSFFVSLIPFVSIASNGMCSFPFVNMTAVSVSQSSDI